MFSSNRNVEAVAAWEKAEREPLPDPAGMPDSWRIDIERLSDQIAQLDYTVGEYIAQREARDEAAEPEVGDITPTSAKVDAPDLAQIGADLLQTLAQMDALIAADATSAQQITEVQVQVQEIRALMDGLQNRLAKPSPAPDLAPQRALLARFVTAMENVGQRQENAASDFEARLDALAARCDTASEDIRATQAATSQSVMSLENSLEQMRAMLEAHTASLAPEAITAAVLRGLEPVVTSAPDTTALDTAFEALQDKYLAPLQTTLQQVDARLSAPPPALDLTPQRALLSRFVTAMENVGRRQETAASSFEARLETLAGQIEAPVNTFSAASEDIRATQAATSQSLGRLEDSLERVCSKINERDPDPAPFLEPLQTVLQQVDARLSAPPPGVDLGPQRALLSRFVTAMENVGQRQEAAASDFEARLKALESALDPERITNAILHKLEDLGASRATDAAQQLTGPEISDHLVRGFRLAVAEAVARTSRDTTWRSTQTETKPHEADPAQT